MVASLLFLCCADTCSNNCDAVVAKACPGSSSSLVYSASWNMLVPVVQCSGHGQCGPLPCAATDGTCSVSCSCDTGAVNGGPSYVGTVDCSIDADTLQALQTARGQLLNALVRYMHYIPHFDGAVVCASLLLTCVCRCLRRARRRSHPVLWHSKRRHCTLWLAVRHLS